MLFLEMMTVKRKKCDHTTISRSRCALNHTLFFDFSIRYACRFAAHSLYGELRRYDRRSGVGVSDFSFLSGRSPVSAMVSARGSVPVRGRYLAAPSAPPGVGRNIAFQSSGK